MYKAALLVSAAIFPLAMFGQTAGQPASDPVDDEASHKHLLWIVPNYRTAVLPSPFKALTVSEKFKIAQQDTFDRGTFALAAAFAGESMLNNSNPSFGGGVKGYAHYWVTAYADFAIGNYFTEGIYPTLLHQDPRFFRRGTGSGLSRFFYSAGQVFLTHGDSGHVQFNFSEFAGNSTSVAISMAYYPENRDVGDAVSKLGSQIAVDMVSNVAKEFWPDIARRFSKRHPDDSARAASPNGK